MNNTKNANYTGPFITMVFLFFIVGFLTVVNAQFQTPLKEALLSEAKDIQTTLATLITFVWFLSYPLTGGIAAKMVDRLGYKKTMVNGLMIMVAGLGIFEGSVLFQEYVGGALTIGGAKIPYAYFIFILGSYVVGAAVTIMQVVINPYLVACKVTGTTDVQRQNIGGSSNSIASTIAPLVVGGVIFGGLSADQISVNKLIVPFMGLIVVMMIVTFIVSRLSLPNIEGTTNQGGEKLERSVWSFRHLKLGVVAIFMYVGVEVAIGANIVMHATDIGFGFEIFDMNVTPSGLAAIYFGGMLVGRLIGASINKVSARTQLLVTSIAAIVLVTLSFFTHIAVLAAVGLCHSIMWPATFSLAIKGLGKYTSVASGALMIGVVGGGVFPVLQGIMCDILGSWELTWLIVLVGEVYMFYYAFAGCKIRKQDFVE